MMNTGFNGNFTLPPTPPVDLGLAAVADGEAFQVALLGTRVDRLRRGLPTEERHGSNLLRHAPPRRKRLDNSEEGPVNSAPPVERGHARYSTDIPSPLVCWGRAPSIPAALPVAAQC